jgi:hypothetical protein
MPRENILLQPLSMTHTDDDRRRSKRIYLQVPIFVRGRDSHADQFMELAKTLDLSAIGALLACPRPSAFGEILTLTVPAPSITPNPVVPSGMAPIQARVIRQYDAGDVHLIGVEFLKPIG